MSPMQFTLQSLLACIHATIQSKTIAEQAAQTLVQKAKQLGQENLSQAELKKLIAQFNALLPKDHAPFPTFFNDFLTTQVKNDVVAFELFLNHKLKSGALTLDKEGPLFSEAILLWRDVGSKLNAKEGCSHLAQLIHRTNVHLPENQRFPIPDDTKY